MDEVIRKVTALGLPGVMLVITVTATGFAGAAAITTALAALGGPFGMLGGIGVLGVMTLVADALSKYGIDTLMAGIYLERSKTESRQKLCKEIDELAVSLKLKLKLKALLD
jgi:hypothetical protein